MRKATGNSERSKRAPRTLAAVAAVLCLGFVAAPAQAGDELRDAFEDQMGRLLAVEAFHTGKWILSGGHYGHRDYGVRYERRYDRGHDHDHYYRDHGHDRHHWKRHAKKHRKWHRKHDRRHHHHGDEPCNIEVHEIKRDRWGDVEYERYERRTRSERYARW